MIADSLGAYNPSQAGRGDFRPLAIFPGPEHREVVGGLYGGTSFGLLRVDRFFLPEGLRRDRIGSRLLATAEEEGRRRGCTRIALNDIESPGARLLPASRATTSPRRSTRPAPGLTRYYL